MNCFVGICYRGLFCLFVLRFGVLLRLFMFGFDFVVAGSVFSCFNVLC